MVRSSPFVIVALLLASPELAAQGAPTEEEEVALAAVEAAAQARLDDAKRAAAEVDAANKLKALADAEAALAAAKDARRKSGFWLDRSLSVGGSFLGLWSQSFVGQTDGISWQTGAILNGALTLGYRGHQWKSALRVEESVAAVPSEVPLMPVLAKVVDDAVLTSEYRFRFREFPWVGPYAQAGAQTQLFPSAVRVTAPTTVTRTERDGTTTVSTAPASSEVPLTSFFEPLTLNEGVGVFAEPPAFPPWFLSSLKLGAAAQHVIARDGYVVAAPPAPGALSLQQLSSTNSFGVDGEGVVSGKVGAGLAWELWGRVYYPLVVVEGTELDYVARTHVDVKGTLAFRPLPWLGVDWVTKVRRQPFIVEDWQLQTSLLMTASYSLL